MRPTPPRRAIRVVLVPMPDPSLEDRYCLGTAHLIAALQQESRQRGLPVEVHPRTDLDRALHTPEHIASEVLSHRPDVVGIGLFVWNQHVGRRVAEILKREDPRLIVVGGGPWVSAEAEDFARENPAFDVIVSGDGEAPFAEVVARVRSGSENTRFAGIPGTVVRVGDDLIATPRVKVDPNAYPSPYQAGLLDVRYSVRMTVRRGCGMHCRYCNWGGGFSVPLSRERLAGDIAWVARQPVEEVWFVDSALNRRVEDLRLIADAFALGDPEGRLRSCIFADWKAVDPERLDLLKRCRLDAAEVGLQTINPGALKVAGRRMDLGRFQRTISTLREQGEVVVDIILGLPGDDPEGFRRTVDFVVGLDVKVHAFLLLALPGSEFSRERARYGLEFNRDGIPFLLRSPTFSSEDLRDCAAYYVTRAPRKSKGSDFYPGNPRFSRYPYNYAVPDEAYRRAHEAFGDPLPPAPCAPGGAEDTSSGLLGLLEEALTPWTRERTLELGPVQGLFRKFFHDRILIELVDGRGARAEVFLRHRTENREAFRRAGPFDIWYGRGATMELGCLVRAIDALAALIEAGVARRAS